MIVDSNKKILPLNPNNLSEEMSHKSPAIVEKITLGIIFSIMLTDTTSGIINIGLTPNNKNRLGVVWSVYNNINNK